MMFKWQSKCFAVVSHILYQLWAFKSNFSHSTAKLRHLVKALCSAINPTIQVLSFIEQRLSGRSTT